MEMNNVAPPIAVPSNFGSAVDIIIPFHGQYAKVTTLLDSIFRFTRSNYYRVCVVDDASPNANFISTIAANAKKAAERRKIDNIVQTIRLPEQRGFAAAMKAGYEATSNSHVCFINSDCRVESVNWLRALGECLIDPKMKEQKVEMVVPKSNNIAGGHESQLSERYVPGPNVVLENNDDFVSMYCFLCKRDLFERCGGFIKEYPFGFYEDQEFAKRMRYYGYRQAVAGDGWIYHEGQQTVKSIWRSRPQVRDVMEKDNSERCIADMKMLKN